MNKEYVYITNKDCLCIFNVLCYFYILVLHDSFSLTFTSSLFSSLTFSHIFFSSFSLYIYFFAVEISFKCLNQTSIDELLNKKYNLENKKLFFDKNYRPFISPNKNKHNDYNESENNGNNGENDDNYNSNDNTAFSVSSNGLLPITLIDDISADHRELKNVMNNINDKINNEITDVKLLKKAKFTILWQIRIMKLLLSPEGIRLFLEIKYHCIYILLCCHPDGNILTQFFQDKPDVLKDFVWLLSTGPGSLAYRQTHVQVSLVYVQGNVQGTVQSENGQMDVQENVHMNVQESELKSEYCDVPIYLRQLACQCLCAIVASRDSANVSILGGKFSWLMHDLGVNRWGVFVLYLCC